MPLDRILAGKTRAEIWALIDPIWAVRIYANLPDELKFDQEIAARAVSFDEKVRNYFPSGFSLATDVLIESSPAAAA